MKNYSKPFKFSKHSLLLFTLMFALGLSTLNLTAQKCTSSKNSADKPLAKKIEGFAWDGKLEDMKAAANNDNNVVGMKLKNEETPLTLAAYQGHTDMVEYLLSKNVDINSRNKWNNSALSNATMQGHNEIVTMLLQKGADINEKGCAGYTGLHQAIQKNHPSTVILLLNKGANVNITEDNGRPPILLASWFGNSEIIAGLINHGADVNFKTEENNTILHNLASNGNEKSVKIALKHGANANAVDNNGRLPLHNAAINGHAEVVEILIPKTNNINLQEKTLGNTPMHIASINGDIKSSKILIEAKAEAGVVNINGKKPIDYAVKYGYAKLVSLYIDNNLASKEYAGKAEESRKAVHTELKDGEAKVTYAGHSGWIVLTQNNVLVFDYWLKSINPDKCLANGSFCEKEMKDKNVYVFVSHEHSDHFDTAIYAWADKVKNITYIFGFKPEDSWLYKERTYNGPAYNYIGNNETREIKNIMVTTIKSTDSGQGFLVETDGIVLYHSGDHAMFTREDEKAFKKEIDFLADNTPEIDIAFLPATGCPARWKKEFIVEGFFYTIDKLNPEQVYPMHAFQREYSLKEFAELAENRKSQTQIVCTENRGDCFEYQKDLTANK